MSNGCWRMSRPWAHVSPDTRLRHIKYATGKELERRDQLDEQDDRRKMQIDQQMQRELVRKEEFDQQDSIGEQMQVEQARSADLDRREGLGMRARREEGMPLGPAQPGPFMKRPTATPTPADGYEPTAPLAPLAPGFTEEDVLRRIEEQRERSAQYAGYDPIGRGMGEVFKAVQYVEEPVAAAALGAVSRSGPLGGPALGPSQQIGETPMERAPIGEDLVNPVSAWLGDEEEQRKAREVLEEAGLPAAIVAQIITSPLNLLPILGVTKVDDFMRLLGLAGRATGPARQSIVRSRTFQEAIKGIREFGERGGPKMPGVGPGDSALGKLRIAGKQAPEGWAENIRMSGEEFGKRSKASAELRDRLISQGMPEQEAILQSTAELRGVMPFKAATGIDFTPAEEAWFWDVIIRGSKTGESVHVATYLQEMRQAAEAGRQLKDLPPHVWKVISRAHGEDFANQLKEVVRQRTGASEAALMAKAPEGVTPGLPVPTSRGAEQAVFHPAYPAPGTTLGEITPKARVDAIEMVADTVGVLKPLMSSADLSIPRQLSKTIGRHPLLTAGAVKDSARAAVSENYAVAAKNAILSEGTTASGTRWTLRGPEGVREIGHGRLIEDRLMAVPGTPGYAESSIMARPEFFVSQLAAKAPVIKQSGRAWATGWNTQYSGITRDWLGRISHWNKGPLDAKLVSEVLDLGERLTGKGWLGESWFARTLKALGFAPGYRLSGPQAFRRLLSPWTNRYVRRMAAEELLTWTLLGNSILGAAKYGAGATVATSLGASQFGRIKFPGSDTYYNIWGTDNVLARAVLMGISQRREDVEGNISPLGTGEKNFKGFATAMRDAMGNYLRSGEDPVVGLISDLYSGETYIGQKLDYDLDSAWKLVSDRMPMALQDIWDVYQTEGPLQAIMAVPGAMFGVGITSYEPIREEARAIPKYNTADKSVAENVLGHGVPEPLNLTSNEERDLLRFLRDDVHDWVEEREDKHGPMPSEISMVQVIQKVGEEKGLPTRLIVGAVFLHKAKSKPGALNREWMKFLLEHRAELKDYYEDTYEADYMQAAQEWAAERGLVPAR